MPAPAPGPQGSDVPWLETKHHRDWLAAEALRQFGFFRASVNSRGGFYLLDVDGSPLPGDVQELHTTTRMIHSFALGKLAGVPGCDTVIEHGMAYLLGRHRDAEHGGYFWALDGDGVANDQKLAYGHVFVLLAGASAKAAGHPDAERLIADAETILLRHFWEEQHGLFRDELNRDWTPFSTYRGMNANMHGVEALLAAFEATGEEKYLGMAGRILDFFARRIAPARNWRLPEHYTENWTIDESYAGNPMFRPAGTTPGHSFELARLLLQYRELSGRGDDAALEAARRLTYQALGDGWDEQSGGILYTLDFEGRPAIRARYWWPVTEAIGALASLMKSDRAPEDEGWYRRLWQFAHERLIDHGRGGWYPEAGGSGDHRQFKGKPDIYHSIQAVLFPLTPSVSGFYEGLKGRF